MKSIVAILILSFILSGIIKVVFRRVLWRLSIPISLGIGSLCLAGIIYLLPTINTTEVPDFIDTTSLTPASSIVKQLSIDSLKSGNFGLNDLDHLVFNNLNIDENTVNDTVSELLNDLKGVYNNLLQVIPKNEVQQ